jgi:hypothetical protein
MISQNKVNKVKTMKKLVLYFETETKLRKYRGPLLNKHCSLATTRRAEKQNKAVSRPDQLLSSIFICGNRTPNASAFFADQKMHSPFKSRRTSSLSGREIRKKKSSSPYQEVFRGTSRLVLVQQHHPTT